MSTQPPARILVVEDDGAIRELLRLALSAEGYDVIVASDGATGLQLLAQSAPKVILLNFILPDTTGLKFMHQYDRLPGPRAPIVLISGALPFPILGEVELAQAMIIAAASLAKPFDLDELLAVVHRLATR